MVYKSIGAAHRRGKFYDTRETQWWLEVLTSFRFPSFFAVLFKLLISEMVRNHNPAILSSGSEQWLWWKCFKLTVNIEVIGNLNLFFLSPSGCGSFTRPITKYRGRLDHFKDPCESPKLWPLEQVKHICTGDPCNFLSSTWFTPDNPSRKHRSRYYEWIFM